ncbi:MAG: helix-turn-helix domain-containing protein, partial [Acholeplasmataceae bacterium]|nr:helix-turn-helix domain-containing protein [Acholeplasmataceae bacterium]
MLKSSQEVGLIIKELRIQKGLTQDQLAAKMQLTPQAVSKWENGDSYPDMHIAIMLADLFDISLDELLRNHIDQSQNEKQEYQIHEIIRCKSLSIEVEEIKFQPNQGGAHLSPNLFINLILKNLSKDGIPLAYDHFMLLYDDGSQVDHKKYLRNWDGDVVSELEPYEIPGFIPPLSEAKVKLEYLSKNSTVKLWVNIPDECPHKCIAIKPQLHLEQAHDDLVLSKNIDDIVYFYNYHYKTNQFSKINFKN